MKSERAPQRHLLRLHVLKYEKNGDKAQYQFTKKYNSITAVGFRKWLNVFHFRNQRKILQEFYLFLTRVNTFLVAYEDSIPSIVFVTQTKIWEQKMVN